MVPDEELDGVYPLALRNVSSAFWTPISVALRATQLFVDGPSARVLDVGSGVGKFCIVGAAASGASFVGLEQRGHFVRAAERAAQRVGVPNARFVHGSFGDVDVRDFDGLYFYNPFEENLWGAEGHLDQTVELSRPRFLLDVARAEQMLARARIGTRVVTYHGFGGEMPLGYEMTMRERQRSGYLDLWVKTSEAGARPRALLDGWLRAAEGPPR